MTTFTGLLVAPRPWGRGFPTAFMLQSSSHVTIWSPQRDLAGYSGQTDEEKFYYFQLVDVPGRPELARASTKERQICQS